MSSKLTLTQLADSGLRFFLNVRTSIHWAFSLSFSMEPVTLRVKGSPPHGQTLSTVVSKSVGLEARQLNSQSNSVTEKGKTRKTGGDFNMGTKKRGNKGEWRMSGV